MAKQNRDNFLRWEGEVSTIPFQNVAFAKYVSMTTGYSYVDVDILAGATSTFGIDINSIAASVVLPPPAPPPRWNAQTQRLRIFRSYGIAASTMKVIYSFRDHLGNVSNNALVTVDLTLLNLGWRANPASVYCLKDAYNGNTGYKGYSLLEQYYTLSGVTYAPLTTKPNIPADPNYVAPGVDTGACPLPSTAPLLLRNDTPPGGSPWFITRVILKLTGNPDIDLNPLAIYPGTTQSFNIPTGIYTSIHVYVQHGTGGPFTAEFASGNSNTFAQAVAGVGVPNIFTGTSSSGPVIAQPGNTIRIY